MTGCSNRAIFREAVNPAALTRALESLHDGAEGIVLADLFGERAGETDFAIAAATLFELFGIAYLVREDRGSVHYTRQAKVTFDIVREDGWSRGRFAQAIEAFKRRNHYGNPNWAPYDFLTAAGEPERLYGYEWVRAQLWTDQMAMSRMECYRVGAEDLWRYRKEPRLPFEIIFPKS